MILKLDLMVDELGFAGEITLKWMSLDLADDKSMLFQVTD